MSNFSSNWLKLRESADHRARNRELLAKIEMHFVSRESVQVIDLGTGTGSNLRAVASYLPTRQYWMLVDHDPELLTAACEAVAAWADSSHPTASGLEASKESRSILIELKQADLAVEPAVWGNVQPDFVTSAALFDLVSAEWIERFVAAVTRTGAVFYTALTYSHSAEWSPPDPADIAMRAAFEKHLGRNKGFGPSAGSHATELLAAQFSAAGYSVERKPSPWRLDAMDDAALIATLVDGWAEAVTETGQVPPTTVASWLKARKMSGISCVIGHEDLLALPPP